VSADQWTQDFPLERDLLVIGRDPRNDIVIRLEVSARHAQIKQCNGGYEIIDLNSRNGLVDRRITQQLLKWRCIVRISSVVTLTYQDEALPEYQY